MRLIGRKSVDAVVTEGDYLWNVAADLATLFSDDQVYVVTDEAADRIQRLLLSISVGYMTSAGVHRRHHETY